MISLLSENLSDSDTLSMLQEEDEKTEKEKQANIAKQKERKLNLSQF